MRTERGFWSWALRRRTRVKVPNFTNFPNIAMVAKMVGAVMWGSIFTAT
jgi:hypothetical protein